jgi:hypothetical protein
VLGANEVLAIAVGLKGSAKAWITGPLFGNGIAQPRVRKMQIIGDFVPLIALLGASIAAVFVYFALAPVPELRITSSWVDEARVHLLLRFELHNKSRVRMRSPRVNVQILQQEIGEQGFLSEWVPFAKDAIRKGEEPVRWTEPAQILPKPIRGSALPDVGPRRASRKPAAKRQVTGITTVYPGEAMVFERLYRFPEDRIILHVAMQLQVKLNALERFVTLIGSRRWTKTLTHFVTKL